MDKTCFITMDVESFYDTLCLKSKNITPDEKYNCASEIKVFLDYLNSKNIHATLFVNVDFLKQAKPYLIDAIKDGHEIALHCYTHKVVDFSNLEQFRKELKEAKKIIKDELGVDAVGYRFPCFKYNLKALEILKEEGFIYDSSIIGADKTDFNKISDVIFSKDDFFEFSPIKRRFLLFFKPNFSGGGLLRILPKSIALRRFKKIIQNGDSYLFYVHPFEISAKDLPKFRKLPLHQQVYLSRGRKEYLNTFKIMIEELERNEYSFPTMSEYINGRRR